MSRNTNTRADIAVESVEAYLKRGGVIHVVPPLNEVKQTLGEEQYVSLFREQYIDTPPAGTDCTPLFRDTPKRRHWRAFVEDGIVVQQTHNYNLDATERAQLLNTYHPHD